MIIRRLSSSLRNQDWATVLIEIVIVVVGVFIGIEVANWNEDREFDARETELLAVLQTELQENIDLTIAKISSYETVGAAGARALSFLEQAQPCTSDCWPLVLDFMHASQWLDLWVNRSAYDAMRRIGLPRDREVVKAVETYYAQNAQMAKTFDISPTYRDLVRGYVSLAIQDSYWENCYVLEGGIESYDMGCPAPVADAVSIKTVAAISADAMLQRVLTKWAGEVRSVPVSLGDEIAAARRAMAAIDADLEQRK